MTKSLMLGIAGLGTVGVGVIKIIQNKLSLLEARTGKQILISAVTAKSKTKDRRIDLSSYQWERDSGSLANREDIDVFIELIGGHEGAAKEAVEIAISKGKNVVTANKDLLAHHGHELALKAEENGSILRFEAAVAGGIPVIKSLTEGLAGNSIRRIIGVMNGTCNYILSEMDKTNDNYQDVLKKEEQLINEELKNLGKPEDIVKKISVGKIKKFKEDNSLLNQQWVMEPKKKVKDIIKELNIDRLKINDFLRIKIGE